MRTDSRHRNRFALGVVTLETRATVSSLMLDGSPQILTNGGYAIQSFTAC